MTTRVHELSPPRCGACAAHADAHAASSGPAAGLRAWRLRLWAILRLLGNNIGNTQASGPSHPSDTVRLRVLSHPAAASRENRVGIIGGAARRWGRRGGRSGRA